MLVKTAGPWPAGAVAGTDAIGGRGADGGMFGTILGSWRRRFRCQQTQPMPKMAARRTVAAAMAMPTMAPVARPALVAGIGAGDVCPGFATGTVEVDAGVMIALEEGGEAEDEMIDEPLDGEEDGELEGEVVDAPLPPLAVNCTYSVELSVPQSKASKPLSYRTLHTGAVAAGLICIRCGGIKFDANTHQAVS